MNAIEMLTGPVAQAIGWALLHLLWQATIIAAVLASVLALLPRESASARYGAACGALALVFAMFVATAVRAWDPSAAPVQTSAPSSPSGEATVSLLEVPVVIAATAAAGWRDRAVDFAATARQSLPSVVAVWLLGVLLLSSRLLVGWSRARALVGRGTREAAGEWQQVADRLATALGLRRAVRLLESAEIDVPSVLGSLRPVILLPASTLTGMTPGQIEMVLAHELAHIRRHDFLVNLLQAFVETLMFYHPAVWWMSRRVRIERENCCDDLALAVCGDRAMYARALTRLEELRASALPVLVSANGGSLLERVRRIAGTRAESTGVSSRWAAAMATLVLLAVTVAVPSMPALAQRETADRAQKSESSIDVVDDRPTPAADAGVDEAPSVDVDGLAALTPEPPEPPEPPDLDFELPEIDIDFYAAVPAPAPPAIPDTPMVPMVAPVMPPMPAIPVQAAMAPLAIPVPTIPDLSLAPMAVTPRVPATPRVAVTPRVPVTPRAPMAIPALAPRAFMHGDEASDRKLSSDGKLTVDELIALKAIKVTPEYVAEMRALFPDLTIRDLTGLRAVGVTAEYVRGIRGAGLAAETAREFTSLKALDVDPAFVSGMREAGLEVKSARDATSLRAIGVTAEYLREMRAAGVKIATARDATSLKATGVTPQFVKKLSDAGYRDLTVRELTRLATVGVDDEFIRDMEKYRTRQ